MKHTPCEQMMWTGIPVIRREFAECMIKDFHLNQKQTAEKLGLTPAAISQYLSGKRGKVKIKDVEILSEIKKSTKQILNNGDLYISKETCRICKIMREKSIFLFDCDICNDESPR